MLEACRSSVARWKKNSLLLLLLLFLIYSLLSLSFSQNDYFLHHQKKNRFHLDYLAIYSRKIKRDDKHDCQRSSCFVLGLLNFCFPQILQFATSYSKFASFINIQHKVSIQALASTLKTYL